MGVYEGGKRWNLSLTFQELPRRDVKQTATFIKYTKWSPQWRK